MAQDLVDSNKPEEYTGMDDRGIVDEVPMAAITFPAIVISTLKRRAAQARRTWARCGGIEEHTGQGGPQWLPVRRGFVSSSEECGCRGNIWL